MKPTQRWLLALLSLPLAVIAAPMLVGGGVDVPDDAMYSSVSTWEWFRTAVYSGRNPFFVPGRLGGASLFTEAMQMGPIYPGMWLAAVLPVSLALPLTFLLHGIGMLLSMRFLARSFGASPLASMLAGAAVAGGAVGAAGFIEMQTDTLPVLVWVPVVIGCHRRLEDAEGRERLRWALWGGLALATMITGSHVRLAAGACGALGVWFILRPRTLHYAIVTTVLGVAGGAVALFPAVLEWQLSSQDSTKAVAALALPPFQVLEWTWTASWLAVKPFVTSREFSLGTVAGVTAVVGLFRAPSHRVALGVHTGLLLLLSADLPPLRPVLFPLTALAHPTLIEYYALAMMPAGVLAALGFDRLVQERRLAWHPAVALVVLGFVIAAIVRVTAASDTLVSEHELRWTAAATARMAVVLVAVAAVLWRAKGASGRAVGLVVIAALDLCVGGVTYHRSIPSTPLGLWDRGEIQDEERLARGSLHIGEMAQLAHDGIDLQHGLLAIVGEEEVEWEDFQETGEMVDLWEEAPLLQAELLHRRWPVHLAMARGWRSISGRAKLPPVRAAGMLAPLARTLAGSNSPWEPVGDDGPSGETPPLEPIFGSPSGIGWRTMVLFGIPVAVGEEGEFFEVPDVFPRCYAPGGLEAVPDDRERLQRLLTEDRRPSGSALVEDEALAADNLAAEVSCEEDGHRVQVQADRPAVIAFREVLNPGWQVTDQDGRQLESFAVNGVHSAVRVPAGETTLRWRFRPPGLMPGAGVSAMAWLIGLGGLAWIRRR